MGQLLHHDDAVAEHIPNGEEPDRAYGLCHTQRMGNLLSALVEVGTDFNNYPFKISPFAKKRSPLLFPFLVLESKQEASSDDDHSILLQSAFAIRTLLKLQNDLRCVSGKERQWSTGGPFVWFLSNRGACWNVAGAYTVHEKNHPLDDPTYVRPTFGWLAFINSYSALSTCGVAQSRKRKLLSVFFSSLTIS